MSDRPHWGHNPHDSTITSDGLINLSYFMWEMQRTIEYERECLEAGVSCGYKLNERLRGLRDTMKDLGYDANEDRINRGSLMIWNADDDWLEKRESELEDIESEIRKVIKGSVVVANDLYGKGYRLDSAEKKKAKRCLNLLERTRRIHRFCKYEHVDEELCRYFNDMKYPRRDGYLRVIGWLSPLRMMLYVRRADVSGWPDIMDCAPHLIQACSMYGLARWIGAEGVLIEMPPGHGKTVLGSCILAIELIRDHNLCTAVLHYKVDDASKRLQNIRDMMASKLPMGRRFRALFPDLVVQKKRCNKTEFWVARESGGKDPSVRACGVNEEAQGRDLHLIWPDDVVAEKERNEETQRNLTYRRLTGTWFARLRGNNTFKLLTFTPWHHEDSYAKLKRYNKSIRIQPRDGTIDHPIPPFIECRLPAGDGGNDFTKPLWDRYPRDYYRTKLKQLGSSLYKCVFNLDPTSVHDKMIRRLHYVAHDIASDDVAVADDSKAFEMESVGIISVDPTATTGIKSDKAGIIRAFVNPVRKKIRIVDAFEIPVNQLDLAQFVYDLTELNKVDEIIVETIGGFHATVDNLVNIHGVPEDLITKIPHVIGKKGVRLQACAAMIEGGVVEFKGDVGADGEVGPHDGYDWFYDEILKFGVVDGDHCLDAVTQLIRIHGSEVWEGEGLIGKDRKKREEENMMASGHRQFLEKQIESLMKPKNPYRTYENIIGEENLVLQNDIMEGDLSWMN